MSKSYPHNPCQPLFMKFEMLPPLCFYIHESVIPAQQRPKLDILNREILFRPTLIFTITVHHVILPLLNLNANSILAENLLQLIPKTTRKYYIIFITAILIRTSPFCCIIAFRRTQTMLTSTAYSRIISNIYRLKFVERI